MAWRIIVYWHAGPASKGRNCKARPNALAANSSPLAGIPALITIGSSRLGNALDQRARALAVAVDDGVSAHKGERLDSRRWIESTHGRKRRAADDEQVRNVPALSPVYPELRTLVGVAGRSLRCHERTSRVLGRVAGKAMHNRVLTKSFDV